MATLLSTVAVILIGVGLLAAAAIFWSALTGKLPHKNPTDEAGAKHSATCGRSAPAAWSWAYF